MAAGALDVFYSPIFMKKSRPAYLLRIMCRQEQIAQMEEIVFTHTTTIGIRRFGVDRTALPRRIETVTTAHGPAQVKVCTFGTEEYVYPEFESVRAICETSGL